MDVSVVHGDNDNATPLNSEWLTETHTYTNEKLSRATSDKKFILITCFSFENPHCHIHTFITLNSSTHNHPKKHTEKQKKSKERRKRRTYTERYIQSKHFIIIRWKTFSLKKIKLSLFFASLSFDINRRYLPTVMVAFAFQIRKKWLSL